MVRNCIYAATETTVKVRLNVGQIKTQPPVSMQEWDIFFFFYTTVFPHRTIGYCLVLLAQNPVIHHGVTQYSRAAKFKFLRIRTISYCSKNLLAAERCKRGSQKRQGGEKIHTGVRRF